MKANPTILITCGEASGDLHAANLIAQLRRKIPDANILAFGGDKVRSAGAKLLCHIEDYSSIVGLSGVLTNLPRLAALERKLKRVLSGVDLFIPVDYPGLNLRLAARAKQLQIPVLYYISPQVWAWGRGRVEKMTQLVDFMAVILPFEEEIYRDEGIPVEFVGHPFVEDHPLPTPRDQRGRSGVGLLPGSRSQEVWRILPVLLETAQLIHAARPEETFAVGLSPSVPRAVYEKVLSRYALDVALEDNAQEVMANSKLLLVASGTATLQGALFETPLIIVYRMSLFDYLCARTVVKIAHIGLVNIILGEEICPEYVQVGARPKTIADKALTLLEDPRERNAMLSRFAGLRAQLTGGGGCRRVAEISERLLNSA